VLQATLSVRELSLVNGEIDGDNQVTVFNCIILSEYFDETSADVDWIFVRSNGQAPSIVSLDSDVATSVFDCIISSASFDSMGDQ